MINQKFVDVGVTLNRKIMKKIKMLKIIFYILLISFVNCGASTRRSLGGRGGITTINK